MARYLALGILVAIFVATAALYVHKWRRLRMDLPSPTSSVKRDRDE